MAAGKLQHELRKKQPFTSPEQEAALSLIRTSDRMQLCFERLFRRHGLHAAQYNILRILRGEGKPLPILEIARRTVTVVPGITGLIDRLERDGLVTRRRSREDRRKVFVEITSKAAQVLARLDEPILQLHRRQLGVLSGSESKQLIGLLEKVRCAVDEEVARHGPPPEE